MPLVTILAREMRLKYFEVDQRFEMLRVALVTILAREMRLKIFQVDQALKMLRVALVTKLAREMRLNFLKVDRAFEMLRVALVIGWSYLIHKQSTSPVEHASQGGASLQFHVCF